MKYHVAIEEQAYTGEQLRSGFAYAVYGVLGDSIVAFRGPCDVKQEYMVDIEDLREGSRIYSENMLHFIIEHHDMDLEKAVLRQLVFTNIVRDTLNEHLKQPRVKRLHTDLYEEGAKLTVSVATVTPQSSIIHFGVNITSLNTPVETKGLADYGIDPIDFAEHVVQAYVSEIEAVHRARCKVRWVK